MTVAPAESPPPARRDRPWLFALAMGAFVFGTGGGVQLIAWEQGPSFRGPLLHVSLVASLVALALRTPIELLARRLLGARGPVLAWRTLGFAALALAVYHVHSLHYFLTRSWSFFAWFGRLWEFEPEVAIVPITALVAGAVLPRVSVASRVRLRVEALVVTLVALALVVMAASRSMRTPEVQRYVEGLPAVGVIPAFARPLRWTSGHDADPSTAREVFTFGPLRVGRYIFEPRGQCGIVLARSLDDLPASVAPAQAEIVPCDEYSVRHDLVHELYVFSHAGAWSMDNHAFRATTLRPFAPMHGEGIDELRSSFSLPRPWLWCSAALLAVALVSLRFPQRSRRALATWKSWHQGTLRADGMIALDEGVIFPCPYGMSLTPGPVVVLSGVNGTVESSPFRAAGVRVTPDREDVRPGTIADVVAQIEAELEARDAYVTAASLLAAAPWVGALALGLIP